MTGEWHARVPIAVEVAEGPGSHAALQFAREQIKGCALLEGIDPDTLDFRLVAPARVQGRIITQTDPITGAEIPTPYMMTARTIQEN